MAKGCPTCPLTDLYNRSFKLAAKEEIEYRGGLPEGCTLQSLLATHSMTSGILADNGEKISPEWSVAFTELARVILQERAQHKYQHDWNDWKKMTAKK